MNIAEPAIRRPVATTLLTIGMMIAGALSYTMLPVAPLPQVDFPTISVSASLPGASPETMATSVATPLERSLSRISGVTEMTSNSTLGSTGITLQFELHRDANAAGRDVQAAINAARSQLPANLPNNPSYRKVNASDSPIMMLTLTSDTYTKPKMFDVAATILQQKLSQVSGVGQVSVGGGSPPAVRVEVNPTVINQMQITLEDIRAAIVAANANRPKGVISGSEKSWTIASNDQLMSAEQYRPLIISYRNGAPVRLEDVAEVTDSIEDVRTFGTDGGRPAITVMIFRQPAANIISTVDRIKSLIPALRAQIPADIAIDIGFDRTTTIRASLQDVQFTLVISVLLVTAVVYVFLRDWRYTLVACIAVPVSLVGTFALMYMFGYTIDNLSLMALTIATGFVVDDAIVVTENIDRYLERGYSAFDASIIGAREIGFTVLSISISLIAVFIPILLMGGVVGLLFREFAITLSSSIVISLVISLTTTPMLCSILLRKKNHRDAPETIREGDAIGIDLNHSNINELSKGKFVLRAYDNALCVVLRHPIWTLVVFVATVALNIYLFLSIPKGFFPQQDTGRLIASLIADQGTSFRTMTKLIEDYVEKLEEDPAVARILSFTGGAGNGGSNVARLFIALKPLGERKTSLDDTMVALRGRVSTLSGANLLMQGVQDLRIGGRPTGAQFQYTLRGPLLRELNEWSQKLLVEMRKIPGIVDVNSDQQDRGSQARIDIDRERASRLGVDIEAIDNTLYDAFGQRQVSTIYRPLNQHRVVMQIDPEFAEGPESVKNIYVRSGNNSTVPLAQLYQMQSRNVSLAVAHTGLFPSATISFNLLPGVSLSDVVPLIEEETNRLVMPQEIQGRFSGTAQAFQSSLATQPMLIIAALVAVYIVLGILYESYIHPLTILSTLPSAGIGAMLALMLFNMELNIVGIIGILLLIGIVKKNAIMMIDFALDAQRLHHLSSYDAIRAACLLRFRPIMMTTIAALLGAVPMAVGIGNGAEMRQPLGVTIVGGLIVSQLITLFTTPVLFMMLDNPMKAIHQPSEEKPHSRLSLNLS